MFNAVMPEGLSPLQQLATVLLGQDLAAYVVEKRTAVPQWSWRLIAEQLRIDTDDKVDVSGESLRSWYGDSERIAS